MAVLEPLVRGDSREHITAARERLERSTFVLAVVGEFSSGKSFLLNAMLGKFGLLATDINPSTATITELKYGERTQAHAYHESGRVERVPVDNLDRFIASDDDPPTRVVIDVDSPFLQRGFTLADTPGLASLNPAHRRATLQFLPNADAVLYLIDTQQPFSEGDAAFLEIIRGHLDTIFIVQTKIDLWRQASESGKEEWQLAAERIEQLAAVHAPGAYVYALSAREYVEGARSGDETLLQQSRFPRFMSALDASLVRNTGRARIRSVYDLAARSARDETERLRRDAEMLAVPAAELQARLAQADANVAEAETFAQRQRDAVNQSAQQLGGALNERASSLADEARRALAQAFDTADIARLRDRAHLHILVDRTLSRTVERFADEIAAALFAEFRTAETAAAAMLDLRFSFAEAAGSAFGGTGTSKSWTDDPQRALRASIVLEAVSGPAIALVQAIAARFSATPPGSYMKRELVADLRAHLWARFHDDMLEFSSQIFGRLATISQAYLRALDAAVTRARDAATGSIQRALDAHQQAVDAAAEIRALQDRSADIGKAIHEIDGIAAAFLERGEEIAAADAGAETVRRAHAAADFDRDAYQKGLRPQRWRVAVLGALRRGKSSLINAFAGHRVLADEVAGAIAYPVHVRYGEEETAFALKADGNWQEIEIESALEEAAHNPVLILTPWTLPRELVLVHAPAFDAGDATLEDVCMVAAREASEILCLFSRQLSERELSLYQRVSALGKPMTFVHTLADNESEADRRHVVELAKEYLQNAAIAVQRMFTVSTLEHAKARRERRAPAGWNELDALISTVGAHAEEHMGRLQRLERAAQLPSERPSVPQAAPPKRRGLLARFFAREHGE